MSYKIAGIDVHKKVLMVVVMDASTPDEKPERRRFATLPSELRRLIDLVTGAGLGGNPSRKERKCRREPQ